MIQPCPVSNALFCVKVIVTIVTR